MSTIDETVLWESYTWWVEISDDGDTWRAATGRAVPCGGIAPAVTSDALARQVIGDRLAHLPHETDFAWDELWFRVTVWDHLHRCDESGPLVAPFPPEQTDCRADQYGRYLRAHRVEPDTILVRTPRQVRCGAEHRRARRVDTAANST